MEAKLYFVYIMASASRTLYTGMTSDPERRVWDHKHKVVPGFTAKYNITMLVWYESTNDVDEAILMEKRIKGKRRAKKIALTGSTSQRIGIQKRTRRAMPRCMADPSVARFWKLVTGSGCLNRFVWPIGSVGPARSG